MAEIVLHKTSVMNAYLTLYVSHSDLYGKKSKKLGSHAYRSVNKFAS